MNAVIKKWGNSFGLRIPKSILSHYNLKDGSEIEISMEDKFFKIEPVEEKRYTLDELISGINKKNIHKEVDFGKTEGNEVW